MSKRDFTNVPIHVHFIPLTLEVMNGLGGVLEGTLTRVGDQVKTNEGLALEPRGKNEGTTNTVFYTHPTLFEAAREITKPNDPCANVRVRLREGVLRMQFMSFTFTELPEGMSSICETEPVKLTSVPMTLALKLITATCGLVPTRCMFKDCEGAQLRPLELGRTALVMTRDQDIVCVCRHCYREERQEGYKLLLAGWELPPRAHVSLWDIPETKVVNP